MSSPPRPLRFRAATFAVSAAALAGCAHGSGSLRDEPTAAAEKACAGFNALAVFDQEPLPENALARGQSFYCLGLYAASVTVLTDHAIGKPARSRSPRRLHRPRHRRSPTTGFRVALARLHPPALPGLGTDHRRGAARSRAPTWIARSSPTCVTHLHVLAARFEYRRGGSRRRWSCSGRSRRRARCTWRPSCSRARLTSASSHRCRRWRPSRRRARDSGGRGPETRPRTGPGRHFHRARVVRDGTARAADRNYDRYRRPRRTGWLPRSRAPGRATSGTTFRARSRASDARGAVGRGADRDDGRGDGARGDDRASWQAPDAAETLTGSSGVQRALCPARSRGEEAPECEPGALYTSRSASVPGARCRPARRAGRYWCSSPAYPSLARRFEELERLQREEARYLALDEQLRSSPVGEEARDALWIRRTAAENEAGEQFRRRLQRLADALGETSSRLSRSSTRCSAKRVDDIDRIEVERWPVAFGYPGRRGESEMTK